jgi:hypothetical protein
MDLQTERAALLNQLEQVDDLELIRAIKQMVTYGLNRDEHISIEAYNKELDEAEREIDRGDSYSQQEVERMAKEW